MNQEPFTAEFEIRWSDLDANRHMKNYAYMEYAIQTRFRFFNANGFSPDAFGQHHIGPVVFRDELKYYRELHLLDQIKIDIRLAGLSNDDVKFMVRNDFYRPDGQLSATVLSEAAWFDLDTRKLTAPPAVLAKTIRNLVRTEDFAEIVRQSPTNPK